MKHPLSFPLHWYMLSLETHMDQKTVDLRHATVTVKKWTLRNQSDNTRADWSPRQKNVVAM